MSNLLHQANQYLAAGEYSAAEELCRKALARPALAGTARRMLADCLYNKGMMHVAYSGMMDAAEVAFLEAVKFNPAHVLALNNLGVIRAGGGALDEAISYYLKALKHDPRNLDSLRNIVIAYQRSDRLDQAEQILKRLAAIDPANAGMYLLREALLIKSIIPDAGYPAQVREKMDRLLDQCLLAKLAQAAPESFAMPYFYLSYHGMPNRELHAKIARAYLHLFPSLAWEAPQARAPRRQGQRIRIGIASSNLFNHSIGHTSRGFVEQLGREAFEVIVIRLGASPQDEIAKAIDDAADSVITVGTGNLQQARERIAALSLDILFYQDIGMDPFSYLLAFARLAPVQVTSFGHPDTTGIPNMDYFISSSLYEPEGAQQHYSEKLLMAPNAGTLSYYIKPQRPDKAAPRAEFGLRDDEHCYFCPQTLFKMHPDMDRVFLRIVERDPLARIVLIEPSGRAMRAALEARWKLASEPLSSVLSERIHFVPRLQYEHYLRLMCCADVVLDTVHFNGQNTNLEAFAMGIPVVTWPGAMQRERHTLGMLAAMKHGLCDDLVADSAEDFADKAVKIAADPAFQADLRARIGDACNVLYQDMDFIRSCERLFAQMMGGIGKQL